MSNHITKMTQSLIKTNGYPRFPSKFGWWNTFSNIKMFIFHIKFFGWDQSSSNYHSWSNLKCYWVPLSFHDPLDHQNTLQLTHWPCYWSQCNFFQKGQQYNKCSMRRWYLHKARQYMAVTSKNNTKVKRGEVLVYSVQERLVRKNSGNLCAS